MLNASVELHRILCGPSSTCCMYHTMSRGSDEFINERKIVNLIEKQGGELGLPASGHMETSADPIFFSLHHFLLNFHCLITPQLLYFL